MGSTGKPTASLRVPGTRRMRDDATGQALVEFALTVPHFLFTMLVSLPLARFVMRGPRGPNSFQRGEGGQSIVETALMLPLLVYLLVGGADLARAFAVQLAVQNGSRAGAEATATQRTPTEVAAATHARQEMGRTPGLDATQAIITMTIANKNGLACNVQPPTPVNPCFSTVRVRYTFRTVIPWPLIPNVFTFDRSTTMRIFW